MSVQRSLRHANVGADQSHHSYKMCTFSLTFSLTSKPASEFEVSKHQQISAWPVASVPPKSSVKRPMCSSLPVHFQSQSDRLHGSDKIMRHINYPICKSRENAWHDCVSPNALLHVSLRTGYKIRPSLRLPLSTNFLNNITKIS